MYLRRGALQASKSSRAVWTARPNFMYQMVREGMLLPEMLFASGTYDHKGMIIHGRSVLWTKDLHLSAFLVIILAKILTITNFVVE